MHLLKYAYFQMKRKIYIINKTGSVNNLRLLEGDLPAPRGNEITVEVKSVGLNFADIFAMLGLYSATPKGSFIPGLEYSGIVLKKGEAVHTISEGDKIMGLTRFGAYATHLNIDADYVVKIPENWSFENGAAFLVNVLTAYYALVELGNIKNNQTVLIHSAAGGVGIYANRIAKKFDAYTIGTIGNPAKIDLLKKEGYNDFIIRGKNFKHELQRKLERNNLELDLVLECIGGRIFKASYNALSPQGRIITYGSANFTPSGSRVSIMKAIYNYLTRPKIDPLKMINTNRSVMGFNLIWLWEKKKQFARMLNEIEKLNLEKPVIGKVFPFEDLLSAVKYLQSGRSVGKVVVKI